ncbi:hypothetical protein GGS23DRAFT_614072 [Durotheca rogersii]|uniref:uncharacterized protein n=1 Tax=Durotheca rogersii TaxID=419775 RepID=UPI0022201AE5|nr:uncharacterized protein GGS23DRAFT_614072 [Durotheca rogersii]KAI5860230.1 hypothetical protein GGS23DRAFT_614072 [Durotheca rogersii]
MEARTEETGDERPPALRIDPPLLNSASPWATTLADLRALRACASTGGVTTRTAVARGGAGFAHDGARHRHAFFGDGGAASASVNNMGYSPVPLDGYLEFIATILAEEAAAAAGGARRDKPFVVSVAGPPADVAAAYARVARLAAAAAAPLALELNLSCPNIPGAPPPAYDGAALAQYLGAVAAAATAAAAEGVPRVPWGVKTPPYTHAGQFAMLAAALRSVPRGGGGGGDVYEYCPASFVTATNTLGACLVLGEGEGGEGAWRPVLLPDGDGHEEEEEEAGEDPPGVGGVAGAPLHPLALGNVAALRRRLDAHPATRHVAVLGVGGVADAAGYRRMRAAGAAAVGLATALGRKGVGVFGEIESGLGGRW